MDPPTDLGLTRTEVTVSTVDLRRALRSVVGHVDPDKDTTLLRRVRVHIQRDNALVVATNRYTAAVAVVSLWDNAYADDDVTLDVGPDQVAEVLAMFRADEKGNDSGDDKLRVRLTDRYVTMTDTAGLFPGKEVTWPRLTTEEQFPDLLNLIGGMLAKAGTGKASTLHTSGNLLALFKAASTVYDSPVVIEPTKAEGGALVLSVGESFVGLLMPIRTDADQLAQQSAWRDAWHRRLGVVDPSTGAVR
jgi:hypothetical protein